MDKITENPILKDMLTPDFTIGKTHFKITKLSAMDGFYLFERIRYDLAQSAPAAKEITEAEGINIFIKSVLGLPPEKLETYRRTLFKNIVYKTASVDGFVTLLDAEDMAFEGMNPSAIYGVLGRALLVNFFESLKDDLYDFLLEIKQSFMESNPQTSPIFSHQS